jgi:hypothetical protein
MRNPRAGYMLIEALAVVGILAVVLGLAAQVLITCTRLSSFGSRAADHAVQAAEAEDAFRAAAREAFAVSPGVGAYRTGADTLVLQTPSPEGPRYTVLGKLRDPQRLTVLKLVDSQGILEPESMTTLAAPVRAAEFTYDTGDPATARRVVLRLTTVGSGKDAPTREIAAALGAISRP